MATSAATPMKKLVMAVVKAADCRFSSASKKVFCSAVSSYDRPVINATDSSSARPKAQPCRRSEERSQ